jgi:uncharacterized protein (TIGR00369 family)
MTDAPAPDTVATLNEHLGGYNRAMGLRITRASPDEVEAEVVVGERHLQPYGVVHGGVHAGMIEAACSTGAALAGKKVGV